MNEEKIKAAPKCIRKIDWTELRTQKTSLLATIQYLEKNKVPQLPEDLTGILHLIDSIQDYAVEELGIPAMSVYDFELEEDRDKSTKAEEFARTSAQRIFELRIESNSTYSNYDGNGDVIPRAFTERIFDDRMHADIIKANMKNAIIRDINQMPTEFQIDENGDYIFDSEMIIDYGGAMEIYIQEQWVKVPKPQVIRCERCNEKLNPDKAVWLELSLTDGKYYTPQSFPKTDESQGCFSFGKDCARTVLTSDPRNENKKEF